MDGFERDDRLTPAADLLPGGLGSIAGDLGRIVGSWQRIVGPRLAAVSTPASLRDGTLRVLCASASWAQALAGMELDVLDRIAGEVGTGVVTRLHARAGGPAPRLEPEPAPPAQPLADLPEHEQQRLESMVESIDDAQLRARLLAAAVASERRRRNR